MYKVTFVNIKACNTGCSELYVYNKHRMSLMTPQTVSSSQRASESTRCVPHTWGTAPGSSQHALPNAHDVHWNRVLRSVRLRVDLGLFHDADKLLDLFWSGEFSSDIWPLFLQPLERLSDWLHGRFWLQRVSHPAGSAEWVLESHFSPVSNVSEWIHFWKESSV